MSNKNEFGNRANVVHLNGVRVSPRKMRVVIDQIRYMDVDEAIALLETGKLFEGRSTDRDHRRLRDAVVHCIQKTKEWETLLGPDVLDRFINIALPRIRDFRGVPTRLSGQGDFTLGLKDQLIFPEIEYDKVDEPRGMNVTIVTTAKNDEEGRELLRLLGMPFRR